MDADSAERNVAPSAVKTQTNPYGTTIERAEYNGLMTVVNTFNDDGRLSSVSMLGDWGEQDLDLRPDGARTLKWATSTHHGVESWNAAGRLDRYQVTFTDSTYYRWNLVDDAGRSSFTTWDGRRTDVDHASSPIDGGTT